MSSDNALIIVDDLEAVAIVIDANDYGRQAELVATVLDPSRWAALAPADRELLTQAALPWMRRALHIPEPPESADDMSTWGI